MREREKEKNCSGIEDGKKKKNNNNNRFFHEDQEIAIKVDNMNPKLTCLTGYNRL